MFKIPAVIPYLVALFLNAFTDLGHKIIIQNTVFKIYDSDMQIMLTAIVNGLILLPFIMLFSPAGFLADKFHKNKIMLYSAFGAVIITIIITLSYYMGWFKLAFAFTFLLALQSAIYSPAKFGYIKELVGLKYISSANAAVQGVTTVAILLGIVFYSILFENSLTGVSYTTEAEILKAVAPIGWLLVLGSIIELYLSYRLPTIEHTTSPKRFDFKKYRSGYYLRKNFKTVTRKKDIWYAILALSVFWSISQVLLAIFGAYAKETLHVENTIIVQGVMALSAIGIVVGSIIAAKYSKYTIHTGLVPIGAIGFSIMIILLPLVPTIQTVAYLFFGFGFFAGFFLVPLNAYIQKHAPSAHLGVILAGNNFVQNIFMLLFLALTTAFTFYGLNVMQLFALMAVVAVVLALFLIKRYALMMIWAILEILLSFRYKFVFHNLQNVPQEGSVLFLGNHSSWIDWAIVQIAVQRRIIFMMERDIYNWFGIHKIFKLGDAIPLSRRASKDSFIKANEYLNQKRAMNIYPEGQITYDGNMNKFHRGYELATKDNEGVIVPFYIDGMFGSKFLSRSKKWEQKNSYGLFFKRRVDIYFEDPVCLSSSVDTIESKIKNLRDTNAT
jgi:acyl-[acyl-carrier-protein]-phospholipid O-acyltransferase / long-chain-fatty-acid--[acyl-carrier-protein] ligase